MLLSLGICRGIAKFGGLMGDGLMAIHMRLEAFLYRKGCHHSQPSPSATLGEELPGMLLTGKRSSPGVGKLSRMPS
jgi:hypothetical protein